MARPKAAALRAVPVAPALATVRSEAPALTLSTDAAEALLLGDWPGNARELRYAVSHAISRVEAVVEKRGVSVAHHATAAG